jgi:hypothetical protein
MSVPNSNHIPTVKCDTSVNNSTEMVTLAIHYDTVNPAQDKHNKCKSPPGSPSIMCKNGTDNRPDYEIEKFWLSFKQSMDNFYKTKQSMPSRPISKWSDRLNKLQATHEYEEIEKCIYHYMTLYGIDLLRVEDRYHLAILNTNIKRWDKVAKKYNFNDSPMNNAKSNLVFILLEIANSYIKSGSEFCGLFSDMELYLIYEDYTDLIKYAVEHHKPAIIDKVKAFDCLSVIKILNTHWHLNLDNHTDIQMSGKKILDMIHNLNS